MSATAHEVALLAALRDALRLLEAGEVEAALPMVDEAAALCAPGAPGLSTAGLSQAQDLLSQCVEAEGRHRRKVVEALETLGAGRRAVGAYQR